MEHFLSLALLTDNVKNGNTAIPSLFIVDMVAILFVHFQVETYKAQEISANIHLNGYTLGTLRKVTIMITLFGLLVLIRMIIPFENHIARLIQHMINQFFVMVVIPTVMIVKNEKILHYAKGLFQFHNNDIYSLNV